MSFDHNRPDQQLTPADPLDFDFPSATEISEQLGERITFFEHLSKTVCIILIIAAFIGCVLTVQNDQLIAFIVCVVALVVAVIMVAITRTINEIFSILRIENLRLRHRVDQLDPGHHNA